MTTFAYIRVSTDQQDHDNQRFGVAEYARNRNLEPVVYHDDTVTGKKSWRDRGLGTLIDQAKPGDVLVVAEISRLARSTLQVLEILQECAEREIAVHIAKNHLVMDGSLHARITATVLGLAAEIEREFISARTTEALARRKAAGLPLGRRHGSRNHNRKLDAHAGEIKALLAKGVSKLAISKIVGCKLDTLYSWMRDNKLEHYIGEQPKSLRKDKPEAIRETAQPKGKSKRGRVASKN